MPSNYAHHHFGQRVWRGMSPWMRRYVQADRTLYEIGQHGPDILFYYGALRSNPVSAVGYKTHEKQGREFFSLKLVYDTEDVLRYAALDGVPLDRN